MLKVCESDANVEKRPEGDPRHDCGARTDAQEFRKDVESEERCSEHGVVLRIHSRCLARTSGVGHHGFSRLRNTVFARPSRWVRRRLAIRKCETGRVL